MYNFIIQCPVDLLGSDCRIHINLIKKGMKLGIVARKKILIDKSKVGMIDDQLRDYTIVNSVFYFSPTFFDLSLQNWIQIRTR